MTSEHFTRKKYFWRCPDCGFKSAKEYIKLCPACGTELIKGNRLTRKEIERRYFILLKAVLRFLSCSDDIIEARKELSDALGNLYEKP